MQRSPFDRDTSFDRYLDKHRAPRRPGDMTRRDWVLSNLIGRPLLIVLPVIGGIIAIVLWLIYAPIIANWFFPNGW